MGLRFFILIFIGILNTAGWAENSPIERTYNQISKGHYCTDHYVTVDEALGVLKSCEREHHLQYLQRSNADIIDWAVFQLAAENLVTRNKCFREQVESMKADNNKKLKKWSQALTAAWFGSQKTQLILDRCQQVEQSMEPADVKRYGKAKAYEMAERRDMHKLKKPVSQSLREICFDKKKVDKIRASHVLFQHTLPGMSSEEYFKVIGKNRNLLLNTKTGKPWTDEEILATNFSNPKTGFANLKVNDQDVPKLTADLTVVLDKDAREKSNVNKEVINSYSASGYHLSKSMRTYLYNEGIVNQVLDDKKLLDTPGGSCIQSKFETSAGGAIADFVVTSVGFGGVYFLAAKSIGKMAGLARRAALLNTAGVGMTLGALPEAGRILRDCNTRTKMKPMSTDGILSGKETLRPLGMYFENHSLDLDDTPHCQEAKTKNVILSPDDQNCIFDAAVSLI
jgi:hypothetical protein